MSKMLKLALVTLVLAVPALADFSFAPFNLTDVRTTTVYTTLAGAPVGDYGSYTVTVDWSNAGTYAWSSEARLSFDNDMADPAYYLAEKAPTSGGSSTSDPTTLTWTGNLDSHFYGGLDAFYFGARQLYYSASYNDLVNWSNVVVTLHDYVPPPPETWPGYQGFEAAVPPTNWTRIASPGHSGQTTWYQANSPFEGSFNASVQYDSALVAQDEWLLSPNATFEPGMQLSGQSNGSVYWGTPPSQGGTYDNYDGEVWVIRGGAYGGGDDTLLGKVDDTWVTNWVWAGFNYYLDDYLMMPGEQFQIGFRYVGLDGAQLNLDAVTLTPEPASLLLLALAGLALRRR